MGANKNLFIGHVLQSNNWGNGVQVSVKGTGLTTNHPATTGGDHTAAGTLTLTISSGAGPLTVYIGNAAVTVVWATSDSATATALATALSALTPAVATYAPSSGTVVVTGIETGAMVTGTATLTTSVIDSRGLDDLGFQFVWAGGGSPVGNLDIQVSNDHQQYGNIVSNPGTWTTITLSPQPAVSGNSGSYFVNLSGLAAQYVRGLFTWTSGYGLLDCYVNGRSI